MLRESRKIMSRTTVEEKLFPLQRYLTNLDAPRILLSFQQIEVILGESLPLAAYHYQAWWVNSRMVGFHAANWLESGFEVSEVRLGDYVEFRKKPKK